MFADSCFIDGVILMSDIRLPPLAPSLIAVGQPALLTSDSPRGGGLYDLSGLDSEDFAFSADGVRYWWRPSSAVTTSSCYTGPNAPDSFNVTLCQEVRYDGSHYGQNLVNQPIFPDFLGESYGTTTVLTSSGLFLQGSDAEYCRGGQLIAFKAVHTAVFLVCDPSACYPHFLNSSYTSDADSCFYTFYIATNAACPQYRLPDPRPVWAVAPSFVIPAGTCGGAGFDVSQSAVDMAAASEEFLSILVVYLLHPCGNITGTLFMIGQVEYDLLYLGIPYASIAPWKDPTWLAVPGGVQLSLYYQDEFGVTTEALVLFLCVPSALTPCFAFVVKSTDWTVDGPSLTTAVVWTVQACSCKEPHSAAVRGSELDLVSVRRWCLYLSTVGAVDLSQVVYDYAPLTMTVRLCGAVSVPECPANSSLACGGTHRPRPRATSHGTGRSSSSPISAHPSTPSPPTPGTRTSTARALPRSGRACR